MGARLRCVRCPATTNGEDYAGRSPWQEDRALSEQMVTYWTNFARSGDPNGKGLAPWPRYDREHVVLHLDSPITVGPDTTGPEFEFLIANEARTH